MFGFFWRYVAAVVLGGGVAGGLYLYNKDDSQPEELVAEVTALSQEIIPVEQPEQVIVEAEAEPEVEVVEAQAVSELEPAVVADEPEFVEPEVEVDPEPEVEVVNVAPDQVAVEPAEIAEAVEDVSEQAPELETTPEPEIVEDAPVEMLPNPEDQVATIEPEPTVVEPEQPEPETIVSEAEPAAVEMETAAAESEPEPEVVAIEPIIVKDAELTATSDAQAPTFDVVRVDNNGTAVVAGTAMPNSTVSIMADGVEISETTADASGEFVAIITTPKSDSAQTIELEAELDGQMVFSDESILILPPLDTGAADGLVDELPPAIIKATPEAVVIIQPSAQIAFDQISIDSISYDDEADISVSGRGTPMNEVFLYVDGIPMANVVILSSGVWEIKLRNLPAGNYTLRADEISSNGEVSSRMETPFQRAYPEDVREAQENDAAPTYIVQPGNSLWVIATVRYGEGNQYTQIFAANQDKIRDPDLIYPGQVFALPDTE